MEFTLDPNASWAYCGPEMEIFVPPADLVRRFGNPIDDGDPESIGAYVFRSATGEVAIVYYRAYELWWLLIKLMRPWFWSKTEPIEFTVSAENHENAKALCEWMASQVELSYRNWSRS